MEENMPPEGTNTSTNSKKKALKAVLLVVLIVGLLVGAFFAGKHNSNKTTTDSAKSSTSNAKTTTKNQSKPDLAPAETAKTIEAVSYPFNAKKKVTIKLGVPTVFDAVAIQSGNNNRGTEQLLTDKYNDEMGRWVIGYRDDRSYWGPSDVSVLAISDSWLNATSNEEQTIDDGTARTEIRTSQQKKKYIADLKAEALACSKDAAKGYQTDDKAFNICSKVNYGRDSFAPVITLKGYAEVDGKPVVMIGYIHISDGTEYTADSNVQLLKDAQAGKLPATISALITSANDALRKTAIKVTDNPLVQ